MLFRILLLTTNIYPIYSFLIVYSLVNTFCYIIFLITYIKHPCQTVHHSLEKDITVEIYFYWISIKKLSHYLQICARFNYKVEQLQNYKVEQNNYKVAQKFCGNKLNFKSLSKKRIISIEFYYITYLYYKEKKILICADHILF